MSELLAARDGGVAKPANEATVLAGRTASELRALAARPETFRTEGLDRATLMRIVEDVCVAPELRARAAVALPSDDADVRARVRTIAANATLPELRIALERSARDEHDVNQALDELDRAVGRP